MTYREILDSFDHRDVAKAFGTSNHHVSIMKQRDRVAAAYWADLVALAQSKGRDDITLEMLAELAKAVKRTAA